MNFSFLKPLGSIVFLFPLQAYAENQASEEAAGFEIAQKVYNRPDGDTARFHLEMTIKRKGSQPRKREFYSFVKESVPGDSRSLIWFILPADIKDTVLLTVDKSNKESDQSIFLPALQRSRKVSSSRKGGQFVGSGYIYEDLRDRDVNKDIHRKIKDTELRGKKVSVIESVPKKSSSSTYSKVVSWIDMKSLIPLKVVFYDAKKKPLKVLNTTGIKKISGIWTSTFSRLKHLQDQTVTDLKLKSVKYNLDISDTVFSKRFLENPSLLKKIK